MSSSRKNIPEPDEAALAAAEQAILRDLAESAARARAAAAEQAEEGDEYDKPEEVFAWFERTWQQMQQEFAAQVAADTSGVGLTRLEKMFAVLSGKQAYSYTHALQRPYSFFLPGLRAQQFWDNPREHFAWIQRLEDNHAVILGELESLLAAKASTRDNKDFTAYMGDGVPSLKGSMIDSGDWRVFYFFHNFVANEEHQRLCPQTTALLGAMHDELLLGMVCFSAIDPGTHIVRHTGPSNMRLTCHLGMTGCEGTVVTVGGERRPYQDARCVVFDDSFWHEVHHTGTRRRVTLMLDFWHPDLTALERAAFQWAMQRGVAEMGTDRFFHSLELKHGSTAAPPPAVAAVASVPPPAAAAEE